jgi:hypothetical protein
MSDVFGDDKPLEKVTDKELIAQYALSQIVGWKKIDVQ